MMAKVSGAWRKVRGPLFWTLFGVALSVLVQVLFFGTSERAQAQEGLWSARSYLAVCRELDPDPTRYNEAVGLFDDATEAFRMDPPDIDGTNEKLTEVREAAEKACKGRGGDLDLPRVEIPPLPEPGPDWDLAEYLPDLVPPLSGG